MFLSCHYTVQVILIIMLVLSVEDLKLERCPVNHADDFVIKLMSFIIDHLLIDATADFINSIKT